MTRKAPTVSQTYYCRVAKRVRQRPVRQFVRCRVNRKRKPTPAELLFARSG